MITLSIIKADTGGYVGHSAVHPEMLALAEDALREAVAAELLIDGHVASCGDDVSLIMTHRHGIDAEPVHALAWRVFGRTTEVRFRSWPIRHDFGGSLGNAAPARKEETMAETATVDRSEWAAVLDRVTKRHHGELVTIELLDLTYGDLHEAERLPLAYLSYDPRDDAVIVAVGGESARYPVVLRHIINHPSEVSAVEERAAGAAVRVIDAEGTPTLVSFFPEPAAS